MLSGQRHSRARCPARPRSPSISSLPVSSGTTSSKVATTHLTAAASSPFPCSLGDCPAHCSWGMDGVRGPRGVHLARRARAGAHKLPDRRCAHRLFPHPATHRHARTHADLFLSPQRSPALFPITAPFAHRIVGLSGPSTHYRHNLEQSSSTKLANKLKLLMNTRGIRKSLRARSMVCL